MELKIQTTSACDLTSCVFDMGSCFHTIRQKDLSHKRNWGNKSLWTANTTAGGYSIRRKARLMTGKPRESEKTRTHDRHWYCYKNTLTNNFTEVSDAFNFNNNNKKLEQKRVFLTFAYWEHCARVQNIVYMGRKSASTENKSDFTWTPPPPPEMEEENVSGLKA